MCEYSSSQRLCINVSCVSSGFTINSKYTLCARRRSTSPIVCEKSTFRSSSFAQTRTGDFQLSIADIADDLYDEHLEILLREGERDKGGGKGG